MRRPVLCAFLAAFSFTLGACSRTLHLDFPASEILLTAPENVQTPLHGVTTYFGGQVPVFVGPSAQPQILSLMSFNSAIWHVYLLPGANVSAIYVSGFEQQNVVIEHSRLDANPSEPRIVDLSGNLVGHGTLSFGPPMRIDGRKGDAYKTELKQETGLDLTGFVSLEQVCLNQAFAVSMLEPPSESVIREHFPQAVVRDFRSADEEMETQRADLESLIFRGALPEEMPLYENAELSAEKVRGWPLLPDTAASLYDSKTSYCGRVQLGTREDDALWCGEHVGYVAKTLWIVGGPGRDIVGDDDEGSQVLSGGSGDDIISADLGNDVLYFGANWGKDVVQLRCNADTAQFAGRTPPAPAYQNSRYVVFGRGVRPGDLHWVSANEIEDRRTGSRIRFVDEPCTNFLAVEPGSVPLPPVAEASAAWPPPAIAAGQ